VFYESTLCVLCISLVLGRFGLVGLVDSTVAGFENVENMLMLLLLLHQEGGGGGEEEWTG
jgi:hypothetical protein